MRAAKVSGNGPYHKLYICRHKTKGGYDCSGSGNRHVKRRIPMKLGKMSFGGSVARGLTAKDSHNGSAHGRSHARLVSSIATLILFGSMRWRMQILKQH